MTFVSQCPPQYKLKEQMEKLYLLDEEPSKNSMTQKEYTDTFSRNSIPRKHGISPQLNNSNIADVQRSDNGRPGAQGSDRPKHAEEVPEGVKLTVLIAVKILGSAFNFLHLFSLMAYSFFGLSSREEDDYSSIFVYGGSIITFLSYFVLYCADINKLTSSIFERRQGESTGTHWAKAGLMGIVLPVFNFIGLIVMFTMVGQDGKTFALGIFVFIAYFLGNALLFFNKGESTESEEHELRDNNPPADNPPADNSTADNALVHNSPAANSPVDNSPRPSIRTFP